MCHLSYCAAEIEEYNAEFREEHSHLFTGAKSVEVGGEGEGADPPAEATTSAKQAHRAGPLSETWKAFMAGGGFEGSEEHLAQYAQPNDGEMEDGGFSQE